MAWFESVTDGGGGACRYKVDIVLTSVGRFTAGVKCVLRLAQRSRRAIIILALAGTPISRRGQRRRSAGGSGGCNEQ